jgi:FAD synthetase
MIRKKLSRFLSLLPFSYDRMRMGVSAVIKRVMVFGVFDGLHEGHWYFLASARKYGDELIVVVARDEVVRVLKNKMPRHNEQERLAMVEGVSEVIRAVLGDEAQGSYGVIAAHNPDIICLGYDQNVLAEDLKEKMRAGIILTIPIRRIASHQSGRMHTSLLIEKK